MYIDAEILVLIGRIKYVPWSLNQPEVGRWLHLIYWDGGSISKLLVLMILSEEYKWT